jgi:alkylhydroperoxidase family enzyme
MSRLDPVDPPYAPEVAKTLDRMMPPGLDPLILFRTVAHNPRVLARFSRGSLLDKGSIPLRTREILILRTTALCGSEYEWGVHVAFFAEAACFTEAQITSTTSTTAEADECWSTAEQAVLALAGELHASATLSDELWAQLRLNWDGDQLMEMVVLCGLYHMVSFVTRAFDIALEEGAPRFPV